MAKTIIRTKAVAGGARVDNVLANSNFQFADNPGEMGFVECQVSIVSDVAENEFSLFADKDFIADEEAAAFNGPPRIDQDPVQFFTVTPGTQIIVNLRNNSGVAQDFRTLVAYTPV